jgi:IMP dehydrogenase/GMP reductase
MKDLTPQFDFDDILIVPKRKTHITSRYRDIKLPNKLPIFTAPMDTVVDMDNIDTFLLNKINVALPRTIKYDEYYKRFGEFYTNPNCFYSNVFVSLGFADIDLQLKTSLRNMQQDMHILIDVANGHMQKILDYCKEIKRLRPDITIMVGNIANPETYTWYAQNKCVDYIRVGIGNGGGCLTTKQSGVGYPMASLIHAVHQERLLYIYDNKDEKDLKVPAIVADGGMKDYSDVIKALALGADYVMIGSIFNKAFESSAANYLYGIKLNNYNVAKYFFTRGYPVKKYFRGMSTKEAQKAMGKTNFKTSEGVVRYRKVEYFLQGWVENFEHYLRNAMSYSNARTLQEFIGNVEICQITKNAYDRFNK